MLEQQAKSLTALGVALRPGLELGGRCGGRPVAEGVEAELLASGGPSRAAS